MNEQTIGTCSICGGPVTLPLIWWSVIPPVATCRQCGATRAEHGPVIDMQPARQTGHGYTARAITIDTGSADFGPSYDPPRSLTEDDGGQS